MAIILEYGFQVYHKEDGKRILQLIYFLKMLEEFY